MKQLLFNVHEVLIIVTLLEALLFALALRFLPNHNPPARRYLQIFLCLVACTLGTTLLTWNASVQATALIHSSWVPMLLSASILLQGPALLLYLQSLSQPVHWRSAVNLLHVIPALTAVALLGYYDLTLYHWLPWHWGELTVMERRAQDLVWAMYKCLPVAYVFACFYSEQQLRKRFLNYFSDLQKTELVLARWVLFGFFIHWFWSCAGYFLSDYVAGPVNDLLGIINNYLTTLLLTGLFVFAWHMAQKAFHPNEPEDTCEEAPEESASSEDLSEKIAAIENGIHRQQLHLDSHINLDRFAERIGLKSRETSSAINRHYQKNFFEFINTHRVEAAKQLLRTAPDQTVLDIAHAAGFNSSSAFHRAFKRCVGMTPSLFRQQGAPAPTQ